MSDAHMHDTTLTPQNEREFQGASTPRLSNTTSAATSDDGPGGAQSRAKGGRASPLTSSGYFGKLTQPALRRLNNAAPDDDDDARSTTSRATDITEFSTTAQAGSVAPSSPGSPMPVEEMERSAGTDDTEHEESSDADASPFWIEQEHGSAPKPAPPEINLAPRTHPLAGGEAEHGGVPLREDKQAEMDEERAEGALGPTYNDAVAFNPSEEDNYSPDEAKEELGTTKRLAKRVKGGAKVISGRMRNDPERVKEGQDMIGQV
ncbi:hypothetical protein B0H14DRAFT_2834543 [Mycena olivaceomarginata]|nr:hypothetical protein B0H14DRAFT_3885731 [Mycena olivaceomarginata]KAJ7820096.1 hypothetical protein B0H14DRAFT_2834543 [Mycena olivaceomarginata]